MMTENGYIDDGRKPVLVMTGQRYISDDWKPRISDDWHDSRPRRAPLGDYSNRLLLI